MRWSAGRLKALTTISLALNLALIIACGWIYLSAQSVYIDYRHYRALDTGISQSSGMAVSDSRADTVKVVMYGDSRIQEWHPPPTLDNTQFTNAGVDGETTTEIRRRFEHDVLRHSPDVVVIQAGINDLTAAVTKGIENPQRLVDNLHNNMQYFIDTLQRNNIQTVVTSIFPHSRYNLSKRLFWDNTLQEKITLSNRVIKEMADASDAQWLDFTPVFYQSTESLQSDLYRDTLHINTATYALLNERLAALLSGLSPRPTNPSAIDR